MAGRIDEAFRATLLSRSRERERELKDRKESRTSHACVPPVRESIHISSHYWFDIIGLDTYNVKRTGELVFVLLDCL